MALIGSRILPPRRTTLPMARCPECPEATNWHRPMDQHWAKGRPARATPLVHPNAAPLRTTTDSFRAPSRGAADRAWVRRPGEAGHPPRDLLESSAPGTIMRGPPTRQSFPRGQAPSTAAASRRMGRVAPVCREHPRALRARPRQPRPRAPEPQPRTPPDQGGPALHPASLEVTARVVRFLAAVPMSLLRHEASILLVIRPRQAAGSDQTTKAARRMDLSRSPAEAPSSLMNSAAARQLQAARPDRATGPARVLLTPPDAPGLQGGPLLRSGEERRKPRPRRPRECRSRGISAPSDRAIRAGKGNRPTAAGVRRNTPARSPSSGL